MEIMKKILVIFAHPAYRRSRINSGLRSAIEGLDGITIHDLYDCYPDFLIDVAREQKLCEEHDVIVYQHPFYWYSTPSILKEWQDLVLEHGWAYGTGATALQGKVGFQALTGGGDASTYQKDGFNRFTVRELTSPYQATANLCGVSWLPPFTVLGVHRGLPEHQITHHAEDYRRTLIALRDDHLDLEKARECEYLNSDLNSIIKTD
jgi:glutathione-regulated potassium-efflux system ancillary protein KefG